MATILRPALPALLTSLLTLLALLASPSPAPAAVAQPELMRVGGLGSRLEALALADGIAYVGVGSTLTAVDIRDPAAPVAIADLQLGGWISDLRLDGERLYVANRSAGALQIVDVADPLAPRLLGASAVPGSPTSVDVAGGYAYIAAYNSGLQVLDVRDPAAPQLVFSSEWNAQGANSSTLDVEVADGMLYLATLGEFIIADISDPRSPQLRAVYELVRSDTDIANGYGLAAAGGYVYLAVASHGLFIFDISNPSSPLRVGIVDTPGWAVDVIVEAGRAYVAEREGGLAVVDVTDPTAGRVLSSRADNGSTLRVALAGGLAFLADSGGGLDIVDVSGPTLVRVGGYGTAGNSADSEVVGELAYVIGAEGLQVVDIRQPARPRVLGAIDLGGNAYDLVVDAGIAYVTGTFLQENRYLSALWLIDLSNPAAPALLSRLTSDSVSFASPWKEGDTLYVVDSGDGLRLIDVSDLRAPSVLRAITPGGLRYLASFQVSGERAYAVEGEDLVVFDRNALEGQALLSRTPLLGSNGQAAAARNVIVHGDTAFVGLAIYLPPQPGDWDRYEMFLYELALVDVSDPSSPRQLGTYTFDRRNSLRDVLVDSPERIIVSTQVGVQLLDIADPASPALLMQLSLDGQVDGLTGARGLIFATGFGNGLQVLATDPRYLGAKGRLDGAGTVTSADSSLSLSFAPGALPGPATVLQLEQLGSERPAIAGEVLRQMAIEARDGAGRAIDGPTSPYLLRVQVEQPDAERLSSAADTRLAVFAWEGAGWSELPPCADCQLQPGQVAVRADSFSELAILRLPVDATAEPSATPSPTATAEPSATASPTATAPSTATATPTAPATATPAASPTRGPATQETIRVYLPSLSG